MWSEKKLMSLLVMCTLTLGAACQNPFEFPERYEGPDASVPEQPDQEVDGGINPDTSPDGAPDHPLQGQEESDAGQEESDAGEEESDAGQEESDAGQEESDAAQAGADTWGTPELVEFADGSATGPSIGFDGAGNCIAVWEQFDGTRTNIWATHYSIGVGWGTPELIEEFDGPAKLADLAVGLSGNAVAVWMQKDDIRWRIGSNHYDLSTGWGSAVFVDSSNAVEALRPRIAIDSSGDAIAVWFDDDGVRQDILWNRYEFGVGWGVAALLENNDAGSAREPMIVGDGVGGLMAAWSHGTGAASDARLWSRRYVPGSGWAAAEIMEPLTSSSPTYSYSPNMAFDASGNGIAVFQSSGRGVWRIHYQAGVGWQPLTRIWPNDGSFVRAPEVSMDASGRAMTLWVRDEGPGYDLWSERYEPDVGWMGPQLVEDEVGTVGFLSHKIAMDHLGNGIALWSQNGRVLARTYLSEQGWDEQEEVDSSGVQRPQLEIDPSGAAIAIWSTWALDGYNIWAARRD
jgi:hypothetical protein